MRNLKSALPGPRSRTLFGALSLVVLAAIPWGTAGAQDLQLTIRPDSTFQTLDNIGTSAAFELNEITDAWSRPNLDTLAMLLFDTTFKPDGSPRGIGMSGFRVEIGACTVDNGDTSRITRVTARSQCPLRPNGSYDWSRMDAEAYWVRKAHDYKLKTVVGYSNSPPIYFTRNGLGCRTQTQFVSNLRPDAYDDFAEYLARVARHFDSVGTPLHYISPVNEPQWTWTCSTQEGTQWSTEEISLLADSVSAAFARRNVSTNITLTEAGQLDFIYSLTSPNNDNNPSLNQLRLWAPTNALYVGNRPKIAPFLVAHSYWTDDSDARLLNIRTNLARAMRDTNPNLRYWQSEFSFLSNGYRDLATNPTRHELSLTLAKVIHADLVIGNAVAWQWWETFESTTNLPRYRLVQVDRDAQKAAPEKNFWALGHYSRFIRPGMRRVHAQRSDALTPLQILRDVMPTVFHNPATGAMTVVLLNYRADARTVKLNLAGAADTIQVTPYLSTDSLSMARRTPVTLGSTLTLPARSITTLVFKTNLIGTALEPSRDGFRARSPRRAAVEIRRLGGTPHLVVSDVGLPGDFPFSLSDVTGKTVFRGTARNGAAMPLSLSPGVYYLRLPREQPSPTETVPVVLF
jgi:O-glycosyl hydrolase